MEGLTFGVRGGGLRPEMDAFDTTWILSQWSGTPAGSSSQVGVLSAGHLGFKQGQAKTVTWASGISAGPKQQQLAYCRGHDGDSFVRHAC